MQEKPVTTELFLRTFNGSDGFVLCSVMIVSADGGMANRGDSEFDPIPCGVRVNTVNLHVGPDRVLRGHFGSFHVYLLRAFTRSSLATRFDRSKPTCSPMGSLL